MTALHTFVTHLASLHHQGADEHARLNFKRLPELRSALVLLASADQAYYDCQLRTIQDSKKLTLDVCYRYAESCRILEGVPVEPDTGSILEALQKYCKIRKEVAGIYRALDESGINVVTGIPKLRSLLIEVTNLKPTATSKGHQPNGLSRLHELVQLELDFLVAESQCLWESNRLEMPAAAVHLAAARQKLAALTDIVIRNLSSKAVSTRDIVSHLPKLLRFLSQLHTASHGKVTLSFLNILIPSPQSPTSAEGEPAVAKSQQRTREAGVPADAEACCRQIDDAKLTPLWSQLKSTRKLQSLGRALRGDQSQDIIGANILRAIETMLDESAARVGTRPAFCLFHNSVGKGFGQALNLNTQRNSYGGYNWKDGRPVSGLQGFPCIASIPVGVSTRDASILLSVLPLQDAGVVECLPPQVKREYMDPAETERLRQSRKEGIASRRKAWGVKVRESLKVDQLNVLTRHEGEVDPTSWLEGFDEVQVPLDADQPAQMPNDRKGLTVLAVRIDLLLYAVIQFDVPLGPDYDLSWLEDWLRKFARCMLAGNASELFTAPSKMPKGV